MVCVYCGSETKVSNSRLQKKANQVWRRRVCLQCDAIFTTREAVDVTRALRIYKNKQYEPFSRDTLLLSVYDSLRHRKTATADATALTETIMSRLLPRIADATLQRQDVLEVTTGVLARFDKAAATSYQAFHPL